MDKKQINITLPLPTETVGEYNRLMQVKELDYKENNIPRYSTVDRWTVNAGDGYEIDVKVCSSNDGDPLWCEAVLFRYGCEETCTDVCDKLDEEYELETDDIRILLTVTIS